MTGQVIQMPGTVAADSGPGWFGRILDVAGPVGSAMLRLHTPDRYGDCKGCGFEELAGLAWPCATVLAAAEAAGVAEIPGL
jgi:hypothetical protein